MIKDETILGLYYASIEDIAVMKLVAISSRGAKKDFYDLYYICKYKEISLLSIFNNISIKFENKEYSISHMITSITYFDDADVESDLNMFVDISYNEVKEFFKNEQIKLMKGLI